MKTARRDWFQILRDLMAAGISMADVARKCNRDPGAVKHWSTGGDPKESDARIVLHLYAKHCPEKYRAHAREFEIPVAGVETRIGRFVQSLMEAA